MSLKNWGEVNAIVDSVGLKYAVEGLPVVSKGVDTVLPSMRKAAGEYAIQRGDYGKANESIQA